MRSMAKPSGPTVSFTSMADGTREDYELLGQYEKEFAAGTADRVLAYLREVVRFARRLPGRPAGAFSADRDPRLSRRRGRGAGGGGAPARHRRHAGPAQPRPVVRAAAAPLRDRANVTGSSGTTACSSTTTTPTTWAATAMRATSIATIPGTRTPWTSVTAGTSAHSIPTTNRCRWSSSSRWCAACSRANRSVWRRGSIHDHGRACVILL